VTDTAIGYLIIGIGLVVVLGVVFAIASRGGGSAERPHPPRGVHLPAPSFLPVVLAVGGSLLGAGLAFRDDGQLANPWLAIPGLVVFVAGAVGWVRAANHEWRDVEHGSHDDGTAAH
jgi:hypothetical protein